MATIELVKVYPADQKTVEFQEYVGAFSAEKGVFVQASEAGVRIEASPERQMTPWQARGLAAKLIEAAQFVEQKMGL